MRGRMAGSGRGQSRRPTQHRSDQDNGGQDGFVMLFRLDAPAACQVSRFR